MWPKVGDVWTSPGGEDVYFVTRYHRHAWYGVRLTAEDGEEIVEMKFHYVDMGPIPRNWILVARQP